MANTTAKQRELARLYESRLDWKRAAHYWQEAINLYPKPYPILGEMAEADLRNLENNRNACLNMLN